MRLLRFPIVLALPLVAAAILFGALQPSAASDRDERRHDEVRRAVEAGDIRPLADIIASVRGQLPGEIAGVEIERENGQWLYEFRVVGDKGQLFEVYIDARSGAIKRIKEK